MSVGFLVERKDYKSKYYNINMKQKEVLLIVSIVGIVINFLNGYNAVMENWSNITQGAQSWWVTLPAISQLIIFIGFFWLLSKVWKMKK
jgi:hypothetical protein